MSENFSIEQFAVLDLYTVLLNRDLHEACGGSGVITTEVNGEVEFEPCVCSDWVAQAMRRYLSLFLKTFQEFPPRQKPASFSIDQVREMLSPSGG